MKVYLYICFFLFNIVSNVTLINAESLISTDERDALISIYLSTLGDEWNTNKGWRERPLDSDGFSKSGTECEWYGITCDDNSESVIGIELCENNLSGNLPDRLYKLKKLKRLNLWVNQISGEIPNEIENLSNLKEKESNFCGNMFFTNNVSTKKFLNRKQFGTYWEKCQAIK